MSSCYSHKRIPLFSRHDPLDPDLNDMFTQTNEVPTESAENGHTWDCPSPSEYGLVGYTIQQWIEQHAERTLPVHQGQRAEVSIDHQTIGSYYRDCTLTFIYKGHLCTYDAAWQKGGHTLFTDAPDSSVHDAIQHSIRWENPLCNKHLKVTCGTRLTALDITIQEPPSVAFDDGVIPSALRDTLRSQTIQHLKHMSGYNGILLHGPTGSGKSLTAKAIIKEASEAGITTCHVTGRINLDFFEKVIQRYLAPCLIVLDNVDHYADDASSRHQASIENLLQFMADLSEREAPVVLVATTNKLHVIDDAMPQSPSNFSRRFQFDQPDVSQIQELLTHYFSHPEALPTDAATQCHQAKFNGSHIAEIRRTADLLSKESEEVPETCFESAFATVNEQFSQQN